MPEHYISEVANDNRTNVHIFGGVLFLQEMRDRDPFRDAVPCFQWQICEPFRLHCPECRSIQLTVPTEGVIGQALRTCLNCENDFIKDWTHIRIGED